MNKSDAKIWYNNLTKDDQKKIKVEFSDLNPDGSESQMFKWIQTFSIRKRNTYIKNL